MAVKCQNSHIVLCLLVSSMDHCHHLTLLRKLKALMFLGSSQTKQLLCWALTENWENLREFVRVKVQISLIGEKWLSVQACSRKWKKSEIISSAQALWGFVRRPSQRSWASGKMRTWREAWWLIQVLSDPLDYQERICKAGALPRYERTYRPNISRWSPIIARLSGISMVFRLHYSGENWSVYANNSAINILNLLFI